MSAPRIGSHGINFAPRFQQASSPISQPRPSGGQQGNARLVDGFDRAPGSVRRLPGELAKGLRDHFEHHHHGHPGNGHPIRPFPGFAPGGGNIPGKGDGGPRMRPLYAPIVRNPPGGGE